MESIIGSLLRKDKLPFHPPTFYGLKTNSILPIKDTLCASQRLRRKCFSVFPSVHAAAKESDNAPETSMDRLVQNRASIVVTDDEIRDYLQQETGKDRVVQMFEKTSKGSYSPEMDFVFSSVQTTSIVTFFFTSVLGSRSAREKRRMNDAILVGGFKVGFAYALKTGLFVGVFTIASQSIAAYRNKSSIIEYMAGGALAGSLAKVMLGPKGMIGGGFVGGTLGLLGGAMILLILKSANETVEQRHYWFVHEKLRKKKEYQLLAESGQ